MMGSKNVNLFIVGAMKAGTTSFMDYLEKHSEVYTSPIKEPNLFIKILPENLFKPSRFFSLEGYFEKEFPAPLHIAKLETELQYQILFSNVTNQKIIVEGSTTYLHAPESAQLINNYNSTAKIIAILRDPLQRAFSHYKMNLGLGKEKSSFEEVIKKEIVAYKNESLSWNSYLGMSFYDTSIRRYKNLFEDVLILKFEALTNNVQEELLKTSQFLNISAFEDITQTHKNITQTIRFQKLYYILNKMGLKDYFSKIFSRNFRQRIFRILSKSQKQALVLSSNTRMEVELIFRKESSKWYY